MRSTLSGGRGQRQCLLFAPSGRCVSWALNCPEQGWGSQRSTSMQSCSHIPAGGGRGPRVPSPLPTRSSGGCAVSLRCSLRSPRQSLWVPVLGLPWVTQEPTCPAGALTAGVSVTWYTQGPGGVGAEERPERRSLLGGGAPCLSSLRKRCFPGSEEEGGASARAVAFQHCAGGWPWG